jgi:hypothetical protein
MVKKLLNIIESNDKIVMLHDSIIGKQQKNYSKYCQTSKRTIQNTVKHNALHTDITNGMPSAHVNNKSVITPS